MPRKKPFENSAIVAQDFPGKRTHALMTRSGKLYGRQYSIVRSQLRNLSLSKPRIDTIMAFYKNYFIKHEELPSMDKLKKLFKF